MTKLFDGGHEQLFDAECSGLRAAWRRAAELSAHRACVESVEARELGKRSGAGSLLRATVAKLLLGSHTMPFIFHASEVSVPDSGINRSPATLASSD